MCVCVCEIDGRGKKRREMGRREREGRIGE